MICRSRAVREDLRRSGLLHGSPSDAALDSTPGAASIADAAATAGTADGLQLPEDSADLIGSVFAVQDLEEDESVHSQSAGDAGSGSAISWADGSVQQSNLRELQDLEYFAPP